MASRLVNAMFVLAVFVQIAVYGATKIRTEGALLESWQQWFGLPYAVIFLVLQIWYCLAFEHPRGLVHLRRTWIGAAVFYILLMVMRPSQVDLGSFIVLVTGLSAMILWAGYHSGKI
jgi:hypothetical protein